MANQYRYWYWNRTYACIYIEGWQRKIFVLVAIHCKQTLFWWLTTANTISWLTTAYICNYGWRLHTNNFVMADHCKYSYLWLTTANIWYWWQTTVKYVCLKSVRKVFLMLKNVTEPGQYGQYVGWFFSTVNLGCFRYGGYPRKIWFHRFTPCKNIETLQLICSPAKLGCCERLGPGVCPPPLHQPEISFFIFGTLISEISTLATGLLKSDQWGRKITIEK